MENVAVIIEELNKIDLDWKIKICKSENMEDIGNQELIKKISDLIGIMRQYKKNLDDKHIAILSEIIADQCVMDCLLNFVDKTLVYFNIMSELRKLENEDGKLVGLFLKDVVENYIVRVDSQIVKRYGDYHLRDEHNMKRILKAIDCLTEYYVRRLFTKKSIEKDFEEETELTQENCQVYSELVDKYFQEIKMNIIMQDMEMCKANCFKE